MNLDSLASIASICGFLLAVCIAIRGIYVWHKKRKAPVVIDKEVTLSWLNQTPLKQAWESKGYNLAWPLLRDLEIKKLEGWEEMLEVDEKNNNIKYRFVVRNKPDHILMGKK